MLVDVVLVPTVQLYICVPGITVSAAPVPVAGVPVVAVPLPLASTATRTVTVEDVVHRTGVIEPDAPVGTSRMVDGADK
jgi:hypothetical protein